MGQTSISSSISKSSGSWYSTALTFNQGVFFTGVKNPTNGGRCIVKHISTLTANLTCFDLPPDQSSYTATLEGVVVVHTASYPIEVRVPFSTDAERKPDTSLKIEPRQSTGQWVSSMSKMFYYNSQISFT